MRNHRHGHQQEERYKAKLRTRRSKHPRQRVSSQKQAGRADRDLWWRKETSDNATEAKSTSQYTKAFRPKKSSQHRGKKPYSERAQPAAPRNLSTLTLYEKNLAAIKRVKQSTRSSTIRDLATIIESLPMPEPIAGIPDEIFRSPTSKIK